MVDLNEIQIHRGLPCIPFGTSPEKVRELLGDPDSSITDESGDIQMEYPKLSLSFNFWKADQYRLGCISSEREGLQINRECLIGKDEDYVERFITEKLHAEVSDHNGCVHEDGQIQMWMDVDSLDLSFWFLDGRLYLVDWFVAWSSNETPDWQSAQAD